MNREIWLEFTFSDAGVFITDWTHTMSFHWTRNNYRDYTRLNSRFVTIAGKNITYHIDALGKTKDEIKALAIWYHINKANGSIRQYRLD